MPLSITASIMATCHGVIQCKLEFDIIDHNGEKDAFEEIWVFYCLEYFHAFMQSERNFKPNKL